MAFGMASPHFDTSKAPESTDSPSDTGCSKLAEPTSPVGPNPADAVLCGVNRCVSRESDDLTVVDRVELVRVLAIDDLLFTTSEPSLGLDTPPPRAGITVCSGIFTLQNER